VIRHLGDLVRLPYRVLGEEEAFRFLTEIMTEDQRRVFDETQEIDFAYLLVGVGRFRVNVFTQARGIGAVFRVIPAKLATMGELRLTRALWKLTELTNGLVLVTGPTGSGKTTTLAAMIDEINRTTARHIITIEDPIEYVHVPDKSAVTQRELGTHTESAASALRAALRESPDVIVVGELRDYETISLALAAAETGVLVLGTLHTNSAAKALDRLISACPEDAQSQIVSVVSFVLKGVVAQHLCKNATGDGRVAVVEVLLNSHAVSNLIREGKFFQIDTYLRSAEASSGMQHLDFAILGYIREGIITVDEGLAVANEPEILRALVDELLVARGEPPTLKAADPS
jgi:twitching motility protein PilT